MSDPALPTSRPIDAPAPVGADERIDSMDVLRGVAVLGILAMNIQSFAMPGSAYMNPTAYGDLEGVNRTIWYVSHLLADMKFWSVFSMLFGAGVLLMTQRCDATGRSARGVHFRRMGWLMLFGLLHAHLVWYGDILFAYGVCGMLLYAFRRRRPRTTIVLGACALMVAFAISLGFGALLSSDGGAEMRAEMAKSWSPDAATVQVELDTYRGGWLDQMSHRPRTALFFETFLFLIQIGWRSLGLMLVGMGLFQLGVFSGERSRRFYATLLLVGLAVGVPIAAHGVSRNEAAGWSVEYSFFYGPLYNYWASVAVALGWVGLVMLVCKAPALRAVTRPFAAAGRMALTCYLMQSLIATTIFYGHGLGRFGHFERWQMLLTVVAIWAFQLVFASLWFRRFRFGPMEWLWRSLTYFRRQPMVRSSPATL